MFQTLQKRNTIVVDNPDILGCVIHLFSKADEVKAYYARTVWVGGRSFYVNLHQAVCVLSGRWDGTQGDVQG